MRFKELLSPSFLRRDLPDEVTERLPVGCPVWLRTGIGFLYSGVGSALVVVLLAAFAWWAIGHWHIPVSAVRDAPRYP